VAKIDDAAILKRAKDLCKDAGIAWDGFAAVPGGRVLDVAGRRECLMRARQQLIKEIGEAVPESFEGEPEYVVGAVMAAAGRPISSTAPPYPPDRIRANAA
jgi:hypothetical protein